MSDHPVTDTEAAEWAKTPPPSEGPHHLCAQRETRLLATRQALTEALERWDAMKFDAQVPRLADHTRSLLESLRTTETEQGDR